MLLNETVLKSISQNYVKGLSNDNLQKPPVHFSQCWGWWCLAVHVKVL